MYAPRASASTSSGWAYSRSIRSRTRRSRARSRRCCAAAGLLVTCAIMPLRPPCSPARPSRSPRPSGALRMETGPVHVGARFLDLRIQGEPVVDLAFRGTGLGGIVEVQERELHRSSSKSFTRPPGESTHRRLRNNAVSTKYREGVFSEDEMRRPILRAVPCARVCNTYELQM